MAITLQDSLTNPFLLLPLLLLLLLTFRRLRKQPFNPPPGPRPLPILGNLHHVGQLAHVSAHHLSQKHGPLLWVTLGRIPTLFVCDADTASQVLKSQDHVFCSRGRSTSIKRFTYGGSDLAFSPFGDHWKQVRRLCNAGVFNLRKVESFRSFRSEEVGLLVGTIAKTSSRGEAVNFSEMMYCYVNNLLFREVFGERASGDGECGLSPFQALLRDVNWCLSSFGVEDVCPWMGWVDRLSGWRRKVEETFEKMDLLFEEKIKKRMSLKSEGRDVNEDFLDALLNVRDDENDNGSFSKDTVKGILLVSKYA